MSPFLALHSLAFEPDASAEPMPASARWWLVATAMLLVLVVLLYLRAAGAGYDFTVKVRGREVTVTGRRVSIALRSSLVQFFTNDFAPKQRLTVHGRRRRNGTYELRFHGRVGAGEKQQLRNFLNSRV
jgi:hypothetical protein